MKTVKIRRKFRVLIIPKSKVPKGMESIIGPSLSTIKKVSGVDLKETDIIETEEFETTWHITIRKEQNYEYQYE